MVKVPVKRKQKQKQKIKQKVKVSQNVKVIVGDVRRKRAVAKKGTSQSAKPPIVLNISNPQPQNNMFMEYFRQQMQNQQPIQANTMLQQERLNERQENLASKAGALHKLDQEPDDVVRELRKQKMETLEKIVKAKAERKEDILQVRSSLKPVSERKIPATPLRPRQPNQRELLMSSIRASVPETPPVDTDMLASIRDQQANLENAISQAGAGEEDDGGVEETKTEVGDWSPSDEQPLSEYDGLYRKPATEISASLNSKKLDELKRLAQQNQVPYNRNGRALNKTELLANLLRHYTTGSPQPRAGRPRKK